MQLNNRLCSAFPHGNCDTYYKHRSFGWGDYRPRNVFSVLTILKRWDSFLNRECEVVFSTRLTHQSNPCQKLHVLIVIDHNHFYLTWSWEVVYYSPQRRHWCHCQHCHWHLHRHRHPHLHYSFVVKCLFFRVTVQVMALLPSPNLVCISSNTSKSQILASLVQYTSVMHE